jgi:hypothetical protein
MDKIEVTLPVEELTPEQKAKLEAELKTHEQVPVVEVTEPTAPPVQ